MAKKKKKTRSEAKDPNFPRPTGGLMHKKNLGGRPTKFNQEIADKIVNYILMGSYVETAAQAAGIHKHTFYEWLKQGAHDQAAGKATLKAKFNDSVTRAVGMSQQRDLKTVDDAAKRDWRAAAWKLERRAPKDWGPKAALKIEEDKEGFSDEENIHAKLAELVSKHEEK